MSDTHFTPGPWVWADWTIHDEDREAQKRGEPYWTLIEPAYGDGNDLAQGPIGRKATDIERVVWGTGWEVEGIDAKNEDRALIAAAPELYEALQKATDLLCRYATDYPESDVLAHMNVCDRLLAKARGETSR